MRITFLAPRLPPAVCGVADHTRFLAEAMAGQGVEVGFLHREPVAGGPEPMLGPVLNWDGGARALEECIAKQAPDWLWIQFSNYGYSRWGAPYCLGRDLRRLRSRMPGLCIAIYLHET